VRQLSFEDGERLKREGIARVEARAPALAEMLRAEAKRIAAERGRVTIDDVRDWMDAHEVIAPHKNFFGSVLRSCYGFRIIGWERSTRKDKHAHMQPVWGLV
jgi:hypothetical protein